MSVNYAALDNLELSLMVNNVLDKQPEQQASNFPGTESEPFNSNVYSAYGRSFFIEARYTFGQ
jgi:outer membrane receptor protein involved in Fe transport